MVNKIVGITFGIFTICLFVDISVKCRFLKGFSGNMLKNENTNNANLQRNKENIWIKLNKETVTWEWDKQFPHPQENEEQFESFTAVSLNQYSEEKKNFFVITAIFNTVSHQSRNNLYRNFVAHMNDAGAQLVTIECIFPLLNQTEFLVTEANNPWHIQLKSDSVYWMKENLINIAVSRLPPHAKWVCWLDADIEFKNPNWVDLTIEKLQKYTVVQMFKKVQFLGPDPGNEILITDYSFGYSVVHNKNIEIENYYLWFPHPGYGWAMSVEDFREINGLPYYVKKKRPF